MDSNTVDWAARSIYIAMDWMESGQVSGDCGKWEVRIPNFSSCFDEMILRNTEYQIYRMFSSLSRGQRRVIE